MASTLYTTYSVDGVAYLYDTYSNAIMKAPPVILQELEKENRPAPRCALTTSRSALADFRNRGFLRPSRLRRMGFYSKGRLRHRVSSHVQQLTLEVTQVCNFRCGYCPFTYDDSRTSPAAATMTFATARRAIDTFRQFSTDAPTRTVSFWGGEPLTNLGLIRQSTEYAHDHAGFNQAHFSFTTNATLITRETARFLARYKFDLLVSLDGPRAIHDSQRLKVNGAPTFDAVTRGLQRLRDFDPDYYGTVRFNCVVARDTDLEALQTFFETFELTAGHEVTLSPATHRGLPDSKETARFGGLSAAQWSCARRHLVSGPRDSQGMPDLIAKLCGRQFESIVMRARRPLRTAVHPNGCCVPLLRKMVVTVAGDVLMCEQSPYVNVLGNVNAGLAAEAAMALVTEHCRHSIDQCQHCWAVRLCSVCYRDTLRDGKWAPESRGSLCAARRERIRSTLMEYTSIVHDNPSAFEYVQNMSFSFPV